MILDAVTLEKIQTAAKWDKLSLYLSTLEVLVDGDIYSVNDNSILHITERIATMDPIAQEMWYEDWASFLTTKQKLEDARDQRAEFKRLKIEELFA